MPRNVSLVNIVFIVNILLRPKMDRQREDRQKPKSYHHGDLGHALIQAGLELLSEGGAADLDLRKVARRAGVSHAAPYRHFADKQALVAAINEEGFHRLTERIQSALSEVSGDAYARLQAIANAYVQFARENPWLMREMFSGLTLEREAFPDLHAASKAVFTFYVEVILLGQKEGTIVEGDPAALAGVLWSLLHGLAMLIIENQMRPYADGQVGSEQVTNFGIQMLYEGLRHK